jgi:hypothetical protein
MRQKRQNSSWHTADGGCAPRPQLNLNLMKAPRSLSRPWAIPYPDRPTVMCMADVPSPEQRSAMSDPNADRPVRRSHRRDAHLRAVSRTTRGVAALAVLTTLAVGGIAAANTTPPVPKATASAAAPQVAVPVTYAPRPTYPLADDDDTKPAAAAPAPTAYVPPLAPPVSTPAPTAQAPVAASGGS